MMISPVIHRWLVELWEQTKVTARLVVRYFNWIWQHSRLKTTAAQRHHRLTHYHPFATPPPKIPFHSNANLIHIPFSNA
ncbi:hypothetical protein JOY44_28530 (plasmid) [Phormidium sp. CLA17]|uniref:hypothetical protein n=1 Tax=Leptolyngbya sp. Cla-17 TaxID=2803751 RepID=UPI001490BF4C|nr:hypothetical protein [Leptolyngbya sp. Cla-17]